MTRRPPHSALGAAALLAATLFVAHLVGCSGTGGAGTSAPRAVTEGRLVIVGGGLTPGNTRVWRAIADGAGTTGTVGIVPTASAAPDEAVTSARSRFSAVLPVDRVSGIDLPRDLPERADDPRVLAQIDAATVLFFTGGNQSRTTAVLRRVAPAAGQATDTPAAIATRRLLARGGTIAGTSAGAAIMSDPMILGGTSNGSWPAAGAASTKLAPATTADPDADEERAPRAVTLGPGMGYVRGVIVDQHFFSRGRFGRLARAMLDTGIDLGIGIADDRAVLVQAAPDGSASFTALGDHAAMVLQRVTTPAAPSAVLAPSPAPATFRVHLLNDGDRWHAGTLTPATGRTAAVEPLAGSQLANRIAADPWASRKLLEEAVALAARAASSRAATAEMVLAPPTGASVRLVIDARTRLYPPSNNAPSTPGPAAWTIADLLVTIEPAPSSPSPAR